MIIIIINVILEKWRALLNFWKPVKFLMNFFQKILFSKIFNSIFEIISFYLFNDYEERERYFGLQINN